MPYKGKNILHQCECGHRWYPRNIGAGDKVHCPKCGSLHSIRAHYLKPPTPQRFKKEKKVKPRGHQVINPPKSRTGLQRSLDGRNVKSVKIYGER